MKPRDRCRAARSRLCHSRRGQCEKNGTKPFLPEIRSPNKESSHRKSAVVGINDRFAVCAPVRPSQAGSPWSNRIVLSFVDMFKAPLGLCYQGVACSDRPANVCAGHCCRHQAEMDAIPHGPIPVKVFLLQHELDMQSLRRCRGSVMYS